MIQSVFKRAVSTEAKRNFRISLNKLKPAVRSQVEEMMRVNQAGELGAVRIYQGQMAVLGNSKDGQLLREMLEQEKEHKKAFNEIISENNIRPTAFTPIWHAAGFTLGAATALMGREAAMLCTESVETVVGRHYNDQIRQLQSLKDNAEGDNEQQLLLEEISKLFSKFRDEELEHLEHAIENDSRKAPLRGFLDMVIRGGSRAAIWISRRY